jgi:DHA2 family multidrug resistance protein-like MFS transporter
MHPTDGAVPRAGRREWIGVAALALPCMLVVMDLSVLFLAVPSLTADLRPSSTELLWITDVYGFLIAGALIAMGALGDRIGRRKVLLWGSAAFGAASILAALSTSPEMLIAARGIQGIAGATLIPSTMALLFAMFPHEDDRMKAIGLISAGFTGGAALGPILGGVLLDVSTWHAVFLINVPAMAAVLFFVPRYVPEFANPEGPRVDLRSAGLLLIAVCRPPTASSASPGGPGARATPS